MIRRTLLIGGLLAVSTAGYGGAFLFALNNVDPDLIAHPSGYDGSGGSLTVKVCIVPGSSQSLVIPVQNVVDRFNQFVPTVGNLRTGSDNELDSGQFDFESVVFHELGHCIGLAHPNLANESGLDNSLRDYTKTDQGVNGSFDLDAGGDGVQGSPDDNRGDDTNYHWFHVGVNDPFSLPATVDGTNYSNDPAMLPTGDSFVANGDRDVASLFGLPPTEAVMQQGQFNDELQRALTADDVATLMLARSGLDRTSGTGDDYSVTLEYGGISDADSCDITVELSDQTSFAVCSVGG
ncbi:MAG: hypothetical protein R3200_07920, partial [Xanthomonadales bacterium]|nr:hypothetical protein [Xanthomonadales bacterium]